MATCVSLHYGSKYFSDRYKGSLAYEYSTYCDSSVEIQKVKLPVSKQVSYNLPETKQLPHDNAIYIVMHK